MKCFLLVLVGLFFFFIQSSHHSETEDILCELDVIARTNPQLLKQILEITHICHQQQQIIKTVPTEIRRIKSANFIRNNGKIGNKQRHSKFVDMPKTKIWDEFRKVFQRKIPVRLLDVDNGKVSKAVMKSYDLFSTHKKNKTSQIEASNTKQGQDKDKDEGKHQGDKEFEFVLTAD